MKNALQLFSIVPTKKTGTGKKSSVGLLKLLAETQISAFTGAFLMLFMVTVVSAAAFSMNEEIASYSEAAGLPKQAHARGSVLGVAAYGYQSPTCANNVCLRYELVGSNGDGYAANIFYFPQTGSRMTGSIKVNRNRFVYNIRQAGMTATGYNLDEGETYKFDFYSGSRGSGKILNSLSITIPGDSGDQNNCSQPLEIPSNCSLDYSKDSCGQLVCNAIDPLPPTYGYRAVNVGPVAQGYFKEGWIETISQAGSGVEPGDVKVMGWFFDNTNTGGVKGASVDISLKNSATGQEYKLSDWYIDAGTLGQRPDAQNYVAQRIGSSNPSSLEVMRFTARVQNLPSGNYYVYNAKYNGNLFNIHLGNAYQPVIITPKAPFVVPPIPSYGYAGYIENLTVSSDKKAATVTGWAYQNAQLLNINVLLVNGQTQATYAATNIEQQSLSVRPDVVEKLKTMGIVNPGVYKGYFIASFNNLPAGTYTVYYGAYNNYAFVNLAKNSIEISANSVETARVGSVINKNGTVYLVGEGGLYGFPGLSEFSSWGFSFGDVVTANTAESQLVQIGVVPAKQPGCVKPLDQISGKCLNAALSAPTMSLGPSGSIVAGFSQQYNFLSAGAINPKLEFAINWGDGTTNTNLKGQVISSGSTVGVAHTYASAGTYTITVTVIDIGAGSKTTTFTQIVTTPGTVSANTTNWAAAANGAKATASSEFSSSTLNLTFPAKGAIDGEKTGSTWGTGGGWNDATSGAYPDWLQIDFAGAKNISKINIYTLADNYPTNPTASTSAKLYGIVDFQVQYDSGSGWLTVPNGNISGNSVVLKELSFPTINNVTKIRISVTKGGSSIGDFSRIVEVEAF